MQAIVRSEISHLQVANRTEYSPGLVRKQAGGFAWRFEDAV